MKGTTLTEKELDDARIAALLLYGVPEERKLMVAALASAFIAGLQTRQQIPVGTVSTAPPSA